MGEIYDKLKKNVFCKIQEQIKKKYDVNLRIEFNVFRTPSVKLKKFINIISIDIRFKDEVFTNNNEFEFDDEYIINNPKTITNKIIKSIESYLNKINYKLEAWIWKQINHLLVKVKYVH